MKTQFVRVARLITLALWLPMVLAVGAGSARAQTSTAYNVFQQPAPVARAVVVGVRTVELSTQAQAFGPNQMIGTTAGGVLGALIGSKSKSFAVAGVAGPLGSAPGGYAGSRVGAASEAQEVLLRKDDGQVIAITQSVTDGVRFVPGQAVIIIGAGRIAPAIWTGEPAPSPSHAQVRERVGRLPHSIAK